MNHFVLKDDAPQTFKFRIARLLANLFFSFMVIFVDKQMKHWKLYGQLLDTVGYKSGNFNVQVYGQGEITEAVVDVQNEEVNITDTEYGNMKKSKHNARLLIRNRIISRTTRVKNKIIGG